MCVGTYGFISSPHENLIGYPLLERAAGLSDKPIRSNFPSALQNPSINPVYIISIYKNRIYKVENLINSLLDNKHAVRDVF